jgi:UDP-2-acetamido-2,6-beta-L-arabino-hexul-4-ose reductase
MPNAHVEPVELKADARGVLLEPIDAGALGGQRNAHLVLTLPGAIRGNHYHERGTEIAVVLGPALVRLREDGAVRDIGVPYGAAYRLVIPPGVSHAFKGTGSAPLVIVSFNSEIHDPSAPDVVRDEIL